MEFLRQERTWPPTGIDTADLGVRFGGLALVVVVVVVLVVVLVVVVLVVVWWRSC